VTEGGTGRSGLLLDSKTSVPPMGAAAVNDSVQVVVVADPEVKVLGSQVIWETAFACAKTDCRDMTAIMPIRQRRGTRQRTTRPRMCTIPVTDTAIYLSLDYSLRVKEWNLAYYEG
jgi:stage V sporulation protein SpoVS